MVYLEPEVLVAIARQIQEHQDSTWEWGLLLTPGVEIRDGKLYDNGETTSPWVEEGGKITRPGFSTTNDEIQFVFDFLHVGKAVALHSWFRFPTSDEPERLIEDQYCIVPEAEALSVAMGIVNDATRTAEKFGNLAWSNSDFPGHEFVKALGTDLMEAAMDRRSRGAR